MRARTLLAVLAVTVIGVCAAMSIQSARSTRTRKKLDKEALSRWEDEGGPPVPSGESAELSTATG
jgi:hypothetical protein